MSKLLICAFTLLVFMSAVAAQGASQQSVNPGAHGLAPPSRAEAPVVLCVDDKLAAGGQPTSTGYARAAASGFRSVLTLRSPADKVDLARERFMVERNSMRYFNIAVSNQLPRRDQVDQFLGITRDKANHPMLLNCGFAERVAPLMSIFRIVEHGWTEGRAIEEAAAQSGINATVLKKFVRDYLNGRSSSVAIEPLQLPSPR
jgi:protein tyrosine phosphatase (PTP) superfamily phosphohydrolase (DUF442 family)